MKPFKFPKLTKKQKKEQRCRNISILIVREFLSLLLKRTTEKEKLAIVKYMQSPICNKMKFSHELLYDNLK